jgi:hemoglobin
MAVSTSTLWDRLGGERVLRKVVDDFVTLAIHDPKVNYTRGGRFPLDEQAVADAKRTAFEIISAAAGGPYSYTGRSVREIHAGMRISDAEFNAIAADFREALGRSGADESDIDAAMQMVYVTRTEIVEVHA